MRGRTAALFVALVLAMSATPALARTPDAHPAVRVLVHVDPSADPAPIAAAIGGTVDAVIAPLGVVRVALAPGDDVASALRVLARQPHVRAAEADPTVRLATVPNDQYWPTDPFTPGLGQWGMRTTKVDQAWDVVKPSSSLVVAVVDTGIDATHPDLVGATVPGAAFVSAPSAGCSVTTTDENSHGTHVAGIIAANANNGIGIAGAAPGVKVMPIRALDCTGVGATSDIAMGIVWAVDHGARIVSISLGTSEDSATLAAAVQYAIGHGALVVAAAGNCGQGPTRSPCFGTPNLVEYPAAYPGVLGVGATQANDVVASFSTRGPQVGISAPGVGIVSTTPHYPTYQSAHGLALDYASLSGTSQATPLVAAIAALVWSADPTLSAADVTTRLESTADDLGAQGRDPAYGFGRVNALRAVSATLPAFAARYDTASVPRAVAGGASLTVPVRVTNTSTTTWSATGATAVRLSYHWIDVTGDPAVWEGVRTPLPADLPAGATVTVTAAVTAPPRTGIYTLRFDLVRDPTVWFSEHGVQTGDVSVVVGGSLGAAYATGATTSSLAPNASASLPVTLTNTGTLPWAAGGEHPVRLASHWIGEDGSVAVWDGLRADPFAADVQPGQSVTVELPLRAPPPGRYTLRLDLVTEGVGWFSEKGVAVRDLPFAVTTALRASYGSVPAGALVAEDAAAVAVTLTNTGPLPWPARGEHPVHLAYHWLLPDGSAALWDGGRAAPFAADVQPGQTLAVQLPVRAPARTGRYTLRVDLVQEGVAWLSGDGVPPLDVPYAVTTGLGVSYAAVRAGVLSADLPGALPVTLTNTGTRPWPAAGEHPVRLSYHWIDANGGLAVWDGLRAAPFASDVAPGDSVTVRLPIAGPGALGRYTLRIDLVQEGVGWLSGDGVTPHAVAFLVTRSMPSAPEPVYPSDPLHHLIP